VENAVDTASNAAADGYSKETGEQLMRNLLILGCAALLALGISFGSIAGSITDNDGDGVPDQYDNCLTTANGPLGTPGGGSLCDGQEDGDLDGYGNPCDYDANQNGQTDLGDLSEFLDNAVAATTNPVYDGNCNGQTDLGDLSDAIDNAVAATLPGPSQLPCAGTSPCVAE
jgi:hypothetical protein